MRFLIILLSALTFVSCSSNSLSSNDTFNDKQFVNTLESQRFIDSHREVIIKPGNRGEDKIYVKLANGDAAYIHNFESDSPNKLAILKEINIQDSDKFLPSSHSILKEMKELDILSIVDDSESNSYRLYTKYIDTSKLDAQESEKFKYVILYSEDIDNVDKTKIVDLKQNLVEIQPNYYLYSSNFYSDYEELH